MPKVTPKNAPKSTAAVKSAVKPDAKATALAKEAQAAERTKAIEAEVEALAEKYGEFVEAKSKSDNAFFDFCDEVSAKQAELDMSKPETRTMILLAMAESYGIDVKEISMNGKKPGPYAYTLVSKVLAMVFPDDPKVLAKARAKGITTEDALRLARDASAPVKVSGGKGKNADGTKATKKADVLETDDDIKTALSVVISKSVAGGFDLDQIGEIFADMLAEYEADAAAKAESE